MIKSDKLPVPSPTRKKRIVSPATTEHEEPKEEPKEELKEEEPLKRNAFEVLKIAGKRSHLYNVDSIAHLTIEQVVKDYYQYNLSRTDSFLKTGKDVDKNISMIRLVVKFSMCVAQQSLENADIVLHQVQSPMPPSDSPDFILWNRNRDGAALKIRAHAMKRMLEIEQQIKELTPMKTDPLQEAKNKQRKPRVPPPPRPVVSSLYSRIDAASKTGFFSKVTYTITKPL